MPDVLKIEVTWNEKATEMETEKGDHPLRRWIRVVVVRVHRCPNWYVSAR